jgi:hypothetical protein
MRYAQRLLPGSMDKYKNDIDYEGKANKQLSSTFSSEIQNRLFIDGLLWLGRSKQKKL